MKILVLNWRDRNHPQAGGAEVHFHELFRRLVDKGHSVTLLTTRYPGSALTDTLDGISILRWGSTFFFNWEAPFLVRRFLRTSVVDCIIDDVNKIPFFSPFWFRGIPTAVFFHHLLGTTLFKLTIYPAALYVLLLENLGVYLYRKTPCCTVSKSTLEELAAKGMRRDRIVVIENSVDTDFYSPLPRQSKEPDLLLYLGRLKRYKNVEIILQAMQRLSVQGRVLRLIIGGAGEDEQHLRATAGALGVGSRVSFTGFISEEQKLDLYRRAIIFINPSRKEGWGITSIEASACGTAVIANDAPGLRDSVVTGRTGLLYRENDNADLARCITELLDNSDNRMTMEQNGRQWALEFSWDRSAAKVEQWLYTAVLDRQSTR